MKDEENPHLQRRKDPDGKHSEAWKRTLKEMEAIAEDRRADDWGVVTVMAAHTDTVSIDMGDHDDFGLMHIIPNNHVEDFESTYDPDEFTEYLVYGTDIEGYMYVVTELIDPDEKRSILIASQYDMTRAQGMVESAEKEGVLYTHVKKIDGEILGTFAHEEYDPLVTHPSK